MYNRDYLEQAKTNNVSYDTNLISFIKSTYQLFAGSLLAGAAGAYVGQSMLAILMGPLKWVLLIVELALIFFVIPKTKNIPGVNLAVLFGFTFISGLTIAPLLASVAAMANGGMIVAQAFLMTSIAFGGISMFAMTTKKDFSFMGKFLLIALIVLVVAAISNIFIQSSIMQLAIASIGVILFSAFILYDTQNIIKGEYDSPVEAALSLYLNFLNLFTSIIQLLGFANSNDE